MEVARIYNEFHQSLLGFIRSKIRVKEDAEDILHNVFVSIASNLDKLAETEKLKSWIYTITRNAIIDYYRKNATKKNVNLAEDLEHSLSESAEHDPTQGLDGCMSIMIGMLPDQYRQVIIDSEIRGMRQKDLAETYNIAYPTLRSRVQRGRERLKELFYNCCRIEADVRGNIIEVTGKNSCDGPCDPCKS